MEELAEGDGEEGSPAAADGRTQGSTPLKPEARARDKANLDIIWIQDESAEDAASIPDPEVLAEEIAEELAATLAEFAEIATSIRARQREIRPNR